MASVKPFKIEIPDQDLQRLKQKLEDARLPEAVIEDDWEYGTPAYASSETMIHDTHLT